MKLYSEETRPDRAARIRALAEKLAIAASTGSGVDPDMDVETLAESFRKVGAILFAIARETTDSLDRLEAEEREKGK